jgi:predicted branched-subunit amino acid permease
LGIYADDGIYLQLGIGRRRVSRQEKWFAHIPFSIYLGWISVATIVNVAVALYNNDWNGWGLAPQGWTVIMMVVAALLAALVAVQRRDIAYPLVIVWALIAVAVRQAALPLIATVAIGLAVVLFLLVLLIQFKSKRSAA